MRDRAAGWRVHGEAMDDDHVGSARGGVKSCSQTQCQGRGLSRPFGEGVRFRGSQGQLQWRLQVTRKAVGGSYWRLEGRLQVVAGQAKA